MKLISKDKKGFKAETCVLYVSTWRKDSYGLYDYQSQASEQRFEICQACKIFRDPVSCKTKVISLHEVKNGILPPPQYNLFASINISNQQRLVFSKPINETPSSNQYTQDQFDIYLSLRTNQKTKGHQIQQGDIIKFGRLVFGVLEINNGFSKIAQKNMYSRFLQNKQIYHQEKQINGSCKICLGDQNSEINFMVSPCKCKGSCQMVHLQCLKSWIQSKIKKELEGVVLTYNFTKFNCQICKTQFPKVIIYKNKHYSMFTIEKPNKPYILLETLGSHGDNSSIHLVTLKQFSSLKIGRSQQNQLRLTDISVSRNHAELELINGKYYLKDLKSKFGTLIKLKNQVQIKQDSTFQAGRNIYNFKYENNIYPKSMAFINY